MPKKVEVVEQVKLLPKQRIALMQASNDGGRFNQNPDYGVLQTLRYLGLVEQRPKYSPAELKAARAKLEQEWKTAADAVKRRDAKLLERVVNRLRSAQYDADKICWHLTPAARKYLLNGKVTVTVGKAQEEE